jgi:sarcosine oxidase subunit beta
MTATTTDVIVIGGGVMGCSIACHLATSGARVVLIERLAQVGAGATGLCSGGVRHQFSHPLNVQLSIASIGKLLAFEQELGQPIDLRQDGYLFLLTTKELVDDYTSSVAMQQQLGVDSRLLTPNEIVDLTPPLNMEDVLAGAFCPHDGVVDPHGVTAGYARRARELGVEIRLDSEVVSIQTEAGRVSGVTTPDGLISAPVVVNAAGPWAAAIGEMAGVTVPVRPYPRYVWVTRSFENRPQRSTMVIDAETTFYFHREGEGVLMGMGDREETPSFDDEVDWTFLERLTETGVARYPALAEASVLTAWAGLYEVTPDHNALLGQSPELDGFYLATGFSGHGFMHGPIVGEIIADLIVGRDPEIDVSAFRPDRFTGTPAAPEKNVV